MSTATRVIYDIGTSGQILVLEGDVLATFERHQQHDPETPEGGGQLFARFRGSEVIVTQATEPRSTDRRTRFRFSPDRRAERRDISRKFKDGLHYVGDWHTHPEHLPRPSGLDVASIREIFLESKHGLAGLLLLVVGTGRLPESLFVGVSNGERIYEFYPRESCDELGAETREEE